MSKLQALLVGATLDDWCLGVQEHLWQTLAPAVPEQADTLAGGLERLLEEAFHPDLLVVCQVTPDGYAAGDVERLLAVVGLARLIVCYGPWCGGDGRNRVYWPLAARVPHHDFPARLAREIATIQGDRLALPLTAGRDELALAELQPGLESPGGSVRFHVDSPDPAFQSTLADQLTSQGGECSPTAPVDLLLVDVDPWGELTESRLESLIDRFRPRATVLLSNAVDSLPVDPASQLQSAVVLDKLVSTTRPADLLAGCLELARRRTA